MSYSILDNFEVAVIVNLLAYLRDHDRNSIADRLERSLQYARIGALSRQAFFNGVCRDAAFRGISIACSEKNAKFVSDFADLLDCSDDTTSNIDYSKPVCPDHHNCPGWIQGCGCDFCDYRPY